MRVSCDKFAGTNVSGFFFMIRLSGIFFCWGQISRDFFFRARFFGATVLQGLCHVCAFPVTSLQGQIARVFVGTNYFFFSGQISRDNYFHGL